MMVTAQFCRRLAGKGLEGAETALRHVGSRFLSTETAGEALQTQAKPLDISHAALSGGGSFHCSVRNAAWPAYGHALLSTGRLAAAPVPGMAIRLHPCSNPGCSCLHHGAFRFGPARYSHMQPCFSLVADVCIVGAVRTPFGAFQGALKSLTAPQLGGLAIKGVSSKLLGSVSFTVSGQASIQCLASATFGV